MSAQLVRVRGGVPVVWYCGHGDIVDVEPPQACEPGHRREYQCRWIRERISPLLAQVARLGAKNDDHA